MGVLAHPGARAEAATVLLLRPARPAPVATEALVRLRGELAAAGFQVEVADAPGGPDAEAAIDRAAAAANVDAVVAILGDPGRQTAEIHIVDRVTRKTVVRQVPVPARSDRGAEVLAIRALELLRASFLEVALGSAPPPKAGSVAPTAAPARAPVAPDQSSEAPATREERDQPAPARPPATAAMTRPVDAVVRPETGRISLTSGSSGRKASVFAVEVGGVVMGSARGMGPAILPVVRAEAGMSAGWLGRLTLAGFGTRSRVSSGDAAAYVAHSFALIELARRFRAGRRLQPFLSLGAGGARVTAEGLTSWPYAGKADSAWAVLVDAGAGLRVRLGERLQLGAEVHAQGAYPFPVIRFVDTTLAEEGRPTLLAGLALIVRL